MAIGETNPFQHCCQNSDYPRSLFDRIDTPFATRRRDRAAPDIQVWTEDPDQQRLSVNGGAHNDVSNRSRV